MTPPAEMPYRVLDTAIALQHLTFEGTFDRFPGRSIMAPWLLCGARRPRLRDRHPDRQAESGGTRGRYQHGCSE